MEDLLQNSIEEIITINKNKSAFVPPKDKHNIIYITFLFHGAGILLAWHMHINAIDYYRHDKFSPEKMSEPFPPADHFMQILIFTAQVPNVTFSWVNVFIRVKGGLETRMIFSIIIMIATFLVTISLAMMNSRTWTPTFFYITMVCVFIVNGSNAIYQNCLFGIAAKLPAAYTGALVLGNQICGTFASTMDILSKLGTTNLRISAIYYFFSAIVVLVLCIDSILMLKMNRFYSFQVQRQEKLEREAHDVTGDNSVPYLAVIKQAYPQFINAFLSMLITLSVFPAIPSEIHPVNESNAGRFFTSLTCFLTFNLFALVGSAIAAGIQWPEPQYLWICMAVRCVIIPLSLFCNYQPRARQRVSKVLLYSDTAHWLINLVNGLTTGYFTSVAMMYAPSTVDPEYAPVAGMLAAAFLITGVFAGVCMTFLWPQII